MMWKLCVGLALLAGALQPRHLDHKGNSRRFRRTTDVCTNDAISANYHDYNGDARFDFDLSTLSKPYPTQMEVEFNRPVVLNNADHQQSISPSSGSSLKYTIHFLDNIFQHNQFFTPAIWFNYQKEDSKPYIVAFKYGTIDCEEDGTTNPTTTSTTAAPTTTSSPTDTCGGDTLATNLYDYNGDANFKFDLSSLSEPYPTSYDVTFDRPVELNSASYKESISPSGGSHVSFTIHLQDDIYNWWSNQYFTPSIWFKYQKEDSKPSIIGYKYGSIECGDNTVTNPATTTTTTPEPITTTTTPEATTTTTTEPTTPSSTTTTESTSTISTTTTASTTSTSTTAPPTDVCANANYKYDEVLSKSILFYEAQQSGRLPDSNRVAWRDDATVNDGEGVGCGKVDLTGGYFDAGDHVKFGLPMASSIINIAWGMLEFKDGYAKSGQLNYGMNVIKWATDYFLKAHTAPNELVVQIGDGNADHAHWQRAEDIEDFTGIRPCYKITASKPGSEVAADTASAMAIASILFKDSKPSYSATLLEHARQLYDFANNYREKYSDSVPEASQFYNSWSGYNDELAFAGLWMYKATGEQTYLSNGESMLNNVGMGDNFDWDNKGRGAQVLLATINGNQKSQALQYCQKLAGMAKTQYGTVFIQQWGSNRHAANVAFACSVLAKHFPNEQSIDFTQQQIDALLGDNPSRQSFVVGFGDNSPQKPHHRSASCPTDHNQSCGDSSLQSGSANPNKLTGALVGGPSSTTDNWVDNRDDYIRNEVAIDYNAGFQSALAALVDSEC